MKLLNRAICMTIAATQMAVSAEAYTTNGWWNQTQVGMYASAVSFPPGNSLRTGVGEAVALFNRNPSQFRVGIHYDDNSVSRANFESEIWATTNWRWDNPAIEFTRYGANGRILASDILFDANLDYWTASTDATDLWPYGGDGRPFQGTLLHELCHSAGLGHEDGEYNLMGQEWRHVHRRRAIVTGYVGEDAADGLVSIYGRRSGESIEDLSAAHFKWVGDGGEYSEHFRTLLYTTGGQELPFTAFSGMRRYNVSRGQEVQVEFTYENNGETTKSNVAIGFYVSTDDLVTTGDQLIGTRIFNLTRGDVATRKDTFTIPNNLVSGQTYYLGVVVDRTSTFPEVDENNNRAFHIIRVN
jgi:hypothetical protein